MDNNELTKWIDSQRQVSGIAQPGHQVPPELHLHHHAPPVPQSNDQERATITRIHPLFAATYMLFVSLAISIPLALLAAIVESTNRPSVQYIQPPARW